MSISVRTIETGKVPSGCVEPPESLLEQYRDTYGGSLRQWVEEVRGESCQCQTYECEGIDEIGRGDSVIRVSIRFPKTITEKIRAAYQDIRGYRRNISNVSEETAANALHDAHGNLARAHFTCGRCGYQYGHHREGERWKLSTDVGEASIYGQAVGDFPLQSQHP